MQKIINIGIYHTLVAQLDKLARHNRQGSYRTRERYYEAFKRFCAYLADVFHLQRLERISGKHLVSYILHLQDSGKSASTIKTDLSAIRFFHDKLPAPRYRLPDNSELGIELERRRFGQEDRTWSAEEFERMVAQAVSEGRRDYVLAAHLARYVGLRVHECFRVDTATTERAIRESAITVKGKGGKVRTVPISAEVAALLREQLTHTARGHKLLVSGDVPTDRAINAFQQWLLSHREEIQDADDSRPLTAHGLRHTYAAEQYKALTACGTGALDAHFAVSRLLGHERADVTDIYLASLKEEKGGNRA